MGFLREDSSETAMDEEQFDRRLREEQAREIFRRVTNCDSTVAFQQLDLAWQKSYVRELYSENLTSNQIAALTGKPRSTICYIVKGTERKPQEFPVLRETDSFGYLSENGEIW